MAFIPLKSLLDYSNKIEKSKTDPRYLVPCDNPEFESIDEFGAHLVYNLIRTHRCINAIEIGTGFGVEVLYIASAIKGEVLTVDTYTNGKITQEEFYARKLDSFPSRYLIAQELAAKAQLKSKIYHGIGWIPDDIDRMYLTCFGLDAEKADVFVLNCDRTPIGYENSLKVADYYLKDGGLVILTNYSHRAGQDMIKRGIKPRVILTAPLGKPLAFGYKNDKADYL